MPQKLKRLTSAAFLYKADPRVNGEQHSDDCRFSAFPEQGLERRFQHPWDRSPKFLEKRKQRMAVPLGNLVRSVLFEAALRLRLGQTKRAMVLLRARRRLVHAAASPPSSGRTTRVCPDMAIVDRASPVARRISLGLLIVLSDYENRTRCSPNDRFGYASEQDSTKPAAPVTPDDYQICWPISRDVHNDISWVADADKMCCPLWNVRSASKSFSDDLVITTCDLQQLIRRKTDLARIGHRRLDGIKGCDLCRQCGG